MNTYDTTYALLVLYAAIAGGVVGFLLRGVIDIEHRKRNSRHTNQR